MTMRIGTDGLPRGLVEVDQVAYESAMSALKIWLDVNMITATEAEVRAVVRAAVSAATGVLETDLHWIMIAALTDADGVLSPRHRACIIHHFWTAIPADKRRPWNAMRDGRPLRIDFIGR